MPTSIDLGSSTVQDIADLIDVGDLTGITDGQVLSWNTTNTQLEPTDPADTRDWDAATAYTTGQAVYEAGILYEAVQGNTNVQPSTDGGTNWLRVSANEPIAFPVPNWDVGTAYTIDAVVAEGGKLWDAVQANTGVNPTGDNGTNWTEIGLVPPVVHPVDVWNVTRAYVIGDHAISGGLLWRAKQATTGVTPVAGADWEQVEHVPNDREFVDETTLAPAAAGEPTVAEVQTFITNAGITDSFAYYNGTDVDGTEPTYTYWVDGSGTVTADKVPGVAEVVFVDTVAASTLEYGGRYRQLDHSVNLPAITAGDDGKVIDFTPDDSTWATLFGSAAAWVPNGGDLFENMLTNIQDKVSVRLVAHFDGGGSTWRILGATDAGGGGGGGAESQMVDTEGITTGSGNQHYGIPGYLATSNASQTTMTAGRHIHYPFRPTVDITVVGAGTWVRTADAATLIRWAIVELDEPSMTPNATGLVDQGTIDAGTVGVNEDAGPVSVALTAGTLYALVVVSTGAPGVQAPAAHMPHMLWYLGSTTANVPEAYQISGAGSGVFADPLPAPDFTRVSATGAYIALVSLRYTIT